MELSFPKLGLRREASILLPAAVLVLIALSSFTLFSYRAAIERLVEDRQTLAAQIAEGLASQLGGDLPNEATLSRFAVGVEGIAILDRDGFPLIAVGQITGPPPVRVLETLNEPVGTGPHETTGTVIGLTPFLDRSQQTPSYLRVDLEAQTLLGQSRSLPLLVALVLSVNAGLLLLVILYLRHLLRPIDAMLNHARSLNIAADDQGPDDVELLLETFERAVGALSERQPDETAPFEDDVAALQRTLATGLESGLLVLDAPGTLLSINPAGSKLLGIRQNAAPGAALGDLFPDDHELRLALEEAVESGEGVQRRECQVSRDGDELTLGLTVHPLRRDDGAVRGWMGLFADLTEIRRQSEEDRLSQSLEQIGELTAGLAHELRNGLASLRGYLTLLERNASGAVDEVELREDLVEVRHEADHLQRVIEDFLSFARPGSVRIESVDLERLLHRAASDPVLAKIPINIRPEGPCPEIQGDGQLLERALRNLLHNAARAQSQGNHPGEPILVQLLPQDSCIEIHVLDQGPGIAAELRDRLFHPFASGSADGVGLGLALSRRIAQLHGGSIRLDNRPEGGARATLSFPADRFVTKSSESVSVGSL